jgi:hypothetical protein
VNETIIGPAAPEVLDPNQEKENKMGKASLLLPGARL